MIGAVRVYVTGAASAVRQPTRLRDTSGALRRGLGSGLCSAARVQQPRMGGLSPAWAEPRGC